jgi:hypothetical protein
VGTRVRIAVGITVIVPEILEYPSGKLDTTSAKGERILDRYRP